MRRRIGICAAATGLALLLTGCGTDNDRAVTVVGTGKVSGVPDVLNADLGAEVTAADVSTAVDGVNAKAKAMTDAMVTAGVKREDVKTSELSVQPTYGPEGRSVIGYRASNSVHIAVRDLPKASAILDSAVKAGGNDTRISSVAFGLEDNAKLLSDARARAFDDAKARAQQYADLSGLKLKKVKTINEGSSGGPTPMQRQAAPGDSGFALEPGQQTVTFDVTVVWELG
ncbi:SIMPL domain-containing protein [Nocardia sp. NBC_01503]|uniref:SIMPL domain-containing protein n=1 Tax=Nocardia sp. NBC_01503 TaxID=2975997 RepID=UPI002E7BD0D1|nr:SIMPL domain-containing protein [Nocardia sp. NBC_01503]WTL35107.1 SIMPL domain-containing protein [Nocardia sp. NBC_01503]